MAKSNRKLEMWRQRLSRNERAYAGEIAKMDKREAIYSGTGELDPLTEYREHQSGQAYHVRNIVAENVESIIDSTIPQPKVTPRRKADEWRAEIIENMIRNELDRLPMEELNDLMERIVPIQGGGIYHVQWDSRAGVHGAEGEVVIDVVHPKQIVPQDGVYTAIEDMDYVIVKLPQTKAYIHDRYGVDIDDEGESEPDLRGLAEEQSQADDMVTQYIAYYRGRDGHIGLYSWVNQVELEDLEDYQARRVRRCKHCGALMPLRMHIEAAEEDDPGRQAMLETQMELGAQLGKYADGIPVERPEDAKKEPDERGPVCPYCGGRAFAEEAMEFEEIYESITTAHGNVIPGAAAYSVTQTGDAALKPTRIPVYRPNVYPLVLQKSVSVYGQLLGDSDVDKIAGQQNSINWLQKKIDARLWQAGTIMTLPPESRVTIDPNDKYVRLTDISDLSYIHTFEFTGNLEYYFAQMSQDYESARQVLGITDSFQGRQDTTATSGKAKEFAAAQSAGRLESRRRMKDAAWARLFELIFKSRLAWTSEPRGVVSTDTDGSLAYDSFDRYDFLERDEQTGQWYWIDDFLFSVDSSAPLASNREALWQETRMNFTSGAYGDPGQMETLLLFWTEMERLHYPLAATTKKALQARMEQMQQQAAQQAQALAAQGGMPGGTGAGISPAGQANMQQEVSGHGEQPV